MQFYTSYEYNFIYHKPLRQASELYIRIPNDFKLLGKRAFELTVNCFYSYLFYYIFL